MMDFYRTDVHFQLALEERRAMMLKPYPHVDELDAEPQWSAATAVAGRVLVRVGCWLQSLPHRPTPGVRPVRAA
jgi:hypothetical protein